MKIILWSLLFISVARAEEAKTPARWNQLIKLVHQEMNILEKAKRKGPQLSYRMLELHSEKLKLLHERNNREFMDKATKSKIALNKESFFKETRAYYASTKEFSNKFLRMYPTEKLKADVYFVMALNSRDYGTDNITEKYLLETISLVKDSHSSLRHHAETALADFYYNEKRYPEAVVYYERAIKKTEDSWLTKHLFNLSWCYLKVRDFDRAINTIKQAYFETKNPAYENIRDQILENIGSFYVYASRPLEGLEFYLKNEKDPIPYLMPMAAKASDKGHEKETEAILGSVQKLIDKNGWYHYQEELFHTYLDFYNHYKRFYDHEKSSKELVAYYKKAESDKKLKLKVERKDDAIEKMRTLAGFLQIKLAKDMKEDEGNFKAQELDLVLRYFTHLIYLDPTRKVEYFYFRAETHYSVRQFKDAAPSYVEALNEAKLAKNMVYARKALNSLLALTGLEVLEKSENKKYLIFAYSEHLGLWPRDEKSEQIYPKLFNIYLEMHDDKKATGLLRAYNKHYPEHLKEQQGFMTKVLDQFIDKKDTKKLAYWIHQFKEGFLSFPRDTIEKTEIVLGNILFLQYQDMAKKGNKLAAAKGFESIYVNKLYTDKVKYQSAFFAALAYLEMGETTKSFHWQALAHARMTPAEKLERREEQLRIAERTYKLQDFVTSFKLSEFLLKEFCDKRDAIQDRFYEIAIMTSLVEDAPKAAVAVVDKYSKCLGKQETKKQALSQIYQHYEKKGDFFGLRNFIKSHGVDPYITQYRYTLQKWYWEKTDMNLKNHILKEFSDLKHPETLGWLKEMDLFKEAKLAQVQMLNTAIWSQPKFDGDQFNKALEEYLLKLQKFKNDYQSLNQSSQVDLAILSTRIFSEVYLNVGSKIQNIKPQGMAPEMLPDFQKAMKDLSVQFLTVSRQFDQQLDKAIKEKETLAWGSRSIGAVESIENPVFSFHTGLTMDKSKD